MNDVATKRLSLLAVHASDTKMVGVFERFNAKWAEDLSTGCHVWTGARHYDGYGAFYYINSPIRAHRAGYRLRVGEIPPGLDLDHLCRNRACVNPSHLEPVTRSVNVLRGEAALGFGGTCQLGLHDVTIPDAIQVYANGTRRCKECARLASEITHSLVGEAARTLGMSQREYVAKHTWSRDVARKIIEAVK